MKALILSCNTGGGHNSAARAIAEEMQERGDEAYVLDYLCLAGEGVSRLVGDGYVQIVKKTPRLFGLFYKLGMVASRLLKKSPVYYINGRMAKYLDGYLREHPVDVLIMPHLYPAETITYMKRKGMKLPLTVAVMTDYTCIPFWEETDCDYYVLPHEALKKSCVRRGIPAEKLLEGTAQEKILVICGSNRKAEQKLKKEFCKQPRVQILGFTTQMSLYLKACDVLFTKPGGLTSTEAAVTGVPMIHTAPIPGCETVNRKFFMKAGMSWSAITLNGQVEKGIQLMNDPEAVAQMVSAQKKQIHGDAVEKLYEFISGEIQKRNRF